MLNFGLLKGDKMAKNDTSASTQIKVAKDKNPQKSTPNNADMCSKSFKGSK